MSGRMANFLPTDGKDRVRRRRKSHSELEGIEIVTPELDVSEVRRIRIERLKGNTTTRRSVATPKMTSESHATLPSLKSASSQRRKSVQSRHSGKEETKHRRQKSTSKDDYPYVYRSSVKNPHASRTSLPKAGDVHGEEESSDSEADSTQSEPIEAKPRRRKIKIVYVDEDVYKSSKHGERRSRTDKDRKGDDRDTDKSVRSSRTHSRRHSVVDAPTISLRRRHEFQ